MRFSTGILAIIMLALTLPVSVAQAGFIGALTANGTGETEAMFFHGYIDGNDATTVDGVQGQPLLGYLNTGTQGVDPLPMISLDGSKNLETFTINSGGMFTAANPDPQTTIPEYNYIEKHERGAFFDSSINWLYRGKYENSFSDGSGGFVVNNASINQNSGTIDVVVNNGNATTGISGDWVVSLKAGNRFAVYAFQRLVDTTTFTFSDIPKGLSHVSFYQLDSESPTPAPPAMVPEPTSLSVFGIGALFAFSGFRRRRR